MEEFIIETDIGNDCDDAGALAVMNNLIDKLNIKVLGIVCSSSLKESAYCTRIINDYYKHDIEVGYYPIKGYYDNSDHELFTQIISKEYKHDENIVEYNKCLLDAYNKATDKVNLVLIGPMHAFKEFIKDNLELVNSKTKHIYIMGGKFVKEKVYYLENEVEKEWNIVECIEGARDVVSKLVAPKTFVPFETGLILTGSKIRKNNPVRRCYDVSYGFTRYSWDPITVYYAMTKDSKALKETNKGKVSIDEKGYTTFVECKDGNDTLLYPNVSDDELIKIIDEYLN